MAVHDIDTARAALREGKPAELIGLSECGWLDAKDGVYQLDDPAKADELAKDVAAFANTETGGLLVVGISTRKEHDQEILEEVRPVPRDLVDRDLKGSEILSWSLACGVADQRLIVMLPARTR